MIVAFDKFILVTANVPALKVFETAMFADDIVVEFRVAALIVPELTLVVMSPALIKAFPLTLKL